MTSTTQTLARLRDLRLNGMATALTQQTEQPGAYDDLPFLDRLALSIPVENSPKVPVENSPVVYKSMEPLVATFR